jgi:hypothetical protein
MKIIHQLTFCALVCCSALSFGQKKETEAIRSEESITIDGKFDESVWMRTPIAKDFFMFEPDNGTPEKKESRSEVKVIYDNNALYIAATLFDSEVHLINKEITQRDNFGTADLFGIFVNGFNDGQQDFRFFVSASGVQMDCLATENGEDYSWDAIWNSAVQITNVGWQVEMEIPYAALRFSSDENQTWGINFFRELRRFRQKFTWNPVDQAIGAFINQAGVLNGIKNITPPTRLFFIPYTSGYFESNKNDTQSTGKIGMDIKYGINESFTLDAILVPDFGQAAFDNVELNLGPFEQQFNENRPFFTEGTDLFSKGDLVYSRRIGGPPSTFPELNENETVQNFPQAVNLINALKISGRTKDGLGIGLLNAITEKTFVNVKNTVTDETRSVLVEPLTNYSVLVFDQRFNQNSSVSFVNTNVTRFGDFRDANVTALVYDLNSKGNKFNISGDLKMSSIYDDRNYNGYTAFLNLAKIYGKLRYSIASKYMSKEFDNNDLGINFITNYHNIYTNVNYRILNPTKVFNSFRINFNYYNQFENTTGKSMEHYININVNSSTLKNDFIGYGIGISPTKMFDFYEARIPGRVVQIPANANFWAYFSSNYNREFALDFEPSIFKTNQENRWGYGLFVSPRYRFSDKFTLIYRTSFNQQNSDIGWVDFSDDDVILAERNRTTVSNSISGKFAINEKMTFNLSTRHYWSFAENIKYHTLLADGTFTENEAYTTNKNANFNLWNFDLSYSWWFAPGSQLTALYRNNAQDFRREIDKNYGSNISNTFQDNLNHVFSVSLRYFIDYNKVKNWVKKS